MLGMCQTPQSTIVFNNIAQMEAYAGTYNVGLVRDSGWFYKTKDPALVPDNINIFPSGIADYYWVRQTTTPASGISVLVVSTVDSLPLVTCQNNSLICVTDSLRGGFFVGKSTMTGLVPDSGVVFNSATSGFVWMRQLTPSSSLNIKWFGAVGRGMPTYQQDSAAITDAVRYLWNYKGGRLYFPRNDSSAYFYGFNGEGIPIPSNTEIFGDGEGSQIMHVNPIGAKYYRGVIFYTTTYATDSIHNPYVKLRDAGFRYAIFDAPKGQTFIRLRSIADTIHFPVGKLVLSAAQSFYKGVRRRMLQNDINKVIQILHDTLVLKYPLSDSMSEDAEGMAYAYDINNGITESPQLGTDYISENIQIHDLTLAQSSYNMLTGEQYSGQQTPNNSIGLGGTFASRFFNLTLLGYGTFGGNLYHHCDVFNLRIAGARKLYDFGFSSGTNTYHDVTWLYSNNIFTDSTNDVAFMYNDDGNHEFKVYNIVASGNWSGTNVLKIATGCSYLYFWNIVFNLPEYRNNTAAVIDMTDEDPPVCNHDIEISNCTFSFDTVGRFMDLRGRNTFTTQRNIRISDIYFFGNPNTDSSVNSVNILNMGNIQIKSCYVENGDTIQLNNCEGGFFEIQAPNSYLNTDNPYQVSTNSRFRDVSSQGMRIGINSTYAELTNLSVGIHALDSLSVNLNNFNVGVGTYAGRFFDSGSRNTFVGAFAGKGLEYPLACDSSTFIGSNSAPNLVYGNGVTAVGAGSGTAMRTAYYNTVIGSGANVEHNEDRWAVALGAYAVADSFQFALPDSVTNMKIRGLNYEMPSTLGVKNAVLADTSSESGVGKLAWTWSLPRVVWITSNVTTTSNAINGITGLSIQLVGNKTYMVKSKIKLSSNNTDGVNLAVFYGGTGDLVYGDAFGFHDNLEDFRQRIIPDLAGTGMGTWSNNDGLNGGVTLEFLMTTITGGILSMQFGSQNDGSTSTAYAGSWIQVTEVIED